MSFINEEVEYGGGVLIGVFMGILTMEIIFLGTTTNMRPVGALIGMCAGLLFVWNMQEFESAYTWKMLGYGKEAWKDWKNRKVPNWIRMAILLSVIGCGIWIFYTLVVS